MRCSPQSFRLSALGAVLLVAGLMSDARAQGPGPSAPGETQTYDITAYRRLWWWLSSEATGNLAFTAGETTTQGTVELAVTNASSISSQSTGDWAAMPVGSFSIYYVVIETETGATWSWGLAFGDRIAGYLGTANDPALGTGLYVIYGTAQPAPEPPAPPEVPETPMEPPVETPSPTPVATPE